MSTNNRKPFAGPAHMSRFRFLKWILGAATIVAIVIGVWLALRPPTPISHTTTPTATARFVDVTDRAGNTFQHFNGATGKKLLPETMGSGVAVLDFNRDGKPDLFFVNSRPWPGDANSSDVRPTQALYRNRGDGTFEDVSAAYGMNVELYGMGVAVADYDNDGWPDIFITAVGGNRLFRNRSGKRFDDVTENAGFGQSKWPNESASTFAQHGELISFPASAVWFDYDGDNKLDLFVCNYVSWSPAFDLGVTAILPGGKRAYVPPQQFRGAQCQLFRNVDGQRFEDVSLASGVQVSEMSESGALRPVGKALGVVVCDPDRDGWPDIVIANDTVRNFFFHNQPGPNGTRVFKENGLFAGIAYADGRPRGGMGIDAGEIEPEVSAVVIANFTHEPNSLFRLQRTNPILFTDIATEAGLAAPSRNAMKFGAIFFDFDSDGRLDLFTANGHLEPDIATAQPGQTHAQASQLFWNSGRQGELFVPVLKDENRELFPPMVGRGCAYLDFDGDGKLDLVLTENNGRARLFRNESLTTNNRLQLVLAGDGQKTNRDAIGAEITIHVEGKAQRQYLTPTHGYMSQSELTGYFGLGEATHAERVTVRWPGRGETQEWQNVPAGAYRLTQGVQQASQIDH